MVDRLSHHEIEIVAALAEGLTNREIADRVGISESAIAVDGDGQRAGSRTISRIVERGEALVNRWRQRPWQ